METATAKGNGETATEERQRNGGNRALRRSHGAVTGVVCCGRGLDVPVTPNVTRCVVSNWETMDCSWHPTHQDTGLPTNQTLYWRIV